MKLSDEFWQTQKGLLLVGEDGTLRFTAAGRAHYAPLLAKYGFSISNVKTLEKFREVMEELKARKDRTVAIGDGANDLGMMAEAGLSVAFHAKPVVRAQADCAINWSGLDAVVNLFE